MGTSELVTHEYCWATDLLRVHEDRLEEVIYEAQELRWKIKQLKQLQKKEHEKTK